MNFTQMHERLRLELLRRIQRGTLSVSLLARQTGYGQPHLSNYLHGRRQLSLEAVDRILATQHLTVADLVASARQLAVEQLGSGAQRRGSAEVPLVSHQTALFEPYVRPSVVQGLIHLPEGALGSLRTRVQPARRGWERFVAVRIAALDALPMEPLVLPDAIVLIDRHYDSLAAYRPSRANLYAVRSGSHLMLRYADFLAGRLVLRPHNHAFPVDLLEVGPDQSPRNLITGRVALILNET
jgi:transcriptional regulator with XRE-family HTH domain